MSGLLINNTLDVITNYGVQKIQLCIGSITKSKDPVDVLVISAFPGDYTPVRTTLIGALKYDLGINVSQLSRNKQEDLRKLFSCWWSKPLLGNFPFKQILCFEGGFKTNMRPPSTVGEVFRSLVSLCQDREISVMMPLLSTGNQNFSSEMMLRLTVEAAVQWMKNGLPLKTLKIVVYQQNTGKLSLNSQHLSKYFQELKDTFLKLEKQAREKKKTEFEYDFYISHSPNDSEDAKLLVDCLQRVNKDYKIFFENQVINKEKSWQDEMYETMIKCRRVIVLLTPDFLQNTSCIEQYNIALCCTRNLGHQFLAPLFIKDISEMPTYMGLIQYIDCRPLTETSANMAFEKLHLKKINQNSKNMSMHNEPKEKICLGKEYDLFISYSHKDTKIANMIFKYITKIKPHWNIFFDAETLKAGVAWQAKLYTSIENSRNVLALLSANYIESKVCQEEFNLARALCEDEDYACALLEVMLEEIPNCPSWCTPGRHFNFTESKRDEMTMFMLLGNIDYYEREYCLNAVKQTSVSLKIDKVTSTWRKEFAKENFPIMAGSEFTSKEILQSYQHNPSEMYDVILSFHESDRKASEILCTKLKKHIPNLNIFVRPTKGNDSSMLHVIDKGKLIIPLLSNHYVATPHLMEEFNTALCRHRFSKEIVILPIIVGRLPKYPAFPLLSFCLFSTEDSFWNGMTHGGAVKNCMKQAAVVVANIIIRNPTFENSFKTLFSIRELKEWSCTSSSQKEIPQDLSPLLFASNNSSHQVILTELPSSVLSVGGNPEEIKQSEVSSDIQDGPSSHTISKQSESFAEINVIVPKDAKVESTTEPINKWSAGNVSPEIKHKNHSTTVSPEDEIKDDISHERLVNKNCTENDIVSSEGPVKRATTTGQLINNNNSSAITDENVKVKVSIDQSITNPVKSEGKGKNEQRVSKYCILC